MIEGEQPFGGKGRNELDDEKWIASRLLVHKLSEWRCAIRLAPKRVRNKLPEMLSGERRKRDLRYLCASSCDGLELPAQRMGSSNLVVPIGADQQQVSNIRLGQEILEQIERRRVQPLQVVEEERQRVFYAGEHADEAAEHELKATLRLLRLKLGNRWLFAHDQSLTRG